MSPILPVGDPGALLRAAGALAAGLLVVVPTDTVYGIAGRADRPDALDGIFAAKGRPLSLALPVLVASTAGPAGAWSIGERTPQAAALADSFWPGPLTLVVERRPGFRAALGGDGTTVGLRVPGLAPLRTLLEMTGPLATTSANRSGEPTPTTVEAVAAIFGDQVALYLEGGPSQAASSTVVSVTGGRVAILREGPLPAAAIGQALRGALPEAFPETAR